MIFDESVWWQGWRRGCGDGQGAAPADPPSLYKLPAAGHLRPQPWAAVLARGGPREACVDHRGWRALSPLAIDELSRSMLSGFWS